MGWIPTNRVDRPNFPWYDGFMNVLLVDAMPLVYSNFAKVGSLSVQSGPHAGTPTGLRFGFLRSVHSYKKRLQADRVVIAWDTFAPIIKAEGAETYKEGRSEEIELGLTGGKKVNKKEMYDQIPDLKEMIGLTSWVQVELDGFEADDLIGHYARELSSAGHNIFISTTDNDLCQCVSDRVKIFLPKNEKQGRKKDGFKDLDWVRNEFGGPTGVQLTLYRAIVGDKSDNLPGVAGSLGFDLSNHRSKIATCICQTGATSPGQVITALTMAGEHMLAGEIGNLMEEFERQFKIMSLHSPENGTIRVRKGIKKPDQLRELFQKLEFNSMMKEIDALCA